MSFKIIIKGHSSKRSQRYNTIMIRDHYCMKRARTAFGRRYFVNTLINHLEALKAYEELKLRLAIENDENSLESTKAKADFIRDIIEKIKYRSRHNYD